MRVWLELARISNLPTVWTNVLAGWILAGGGREVWQPLAWLLAGGSLLYTGGMFLNDAADVQWDRKNRTQRPIATGRVSAVSVWLAAIIFLGLGSVLLWIGGANLWLVVGLLLAIVAYDLYHKPWKGAVIVMGLCRVLLYLAAGSAVTEGWTWTENGMLLNKALALGAYVVGLTIAARSEAVGQAAAWERWLGWGLLACPALILCFEAVGGGHGWSPIGLFLGFIQMSYVIMICNLMTRPPKSNIGRSVGWLLAGITLVDALAVVMNDVALALVFVSLTPLLRWWQRKIAAT